MTYRISTLVLALVILGSFVPSFAQAAETKMIYVPITPGVPAPTCEVRATRQHPVSGQETTLVWSSKNAYAMYGITKGGEWAPDGRQKVRIAFAGKREFTMMFVGKGGITTCTASVHVHPKKD
ncbi:hypothetical protein KKH15_01020 [Patescibacteria group bacterium]|nr:hypothetical protein [Patescibacteria group bacterium]MBU1754738.1 hypothetical protein [Patescibacteria group bacterium]